jgi:hypothetical protein
MGLEFREKLPERVPDTLPVYRLAEPTSFPESAKQLAGLASNIGLTGRPSQTCYSEDWTSHDEGLFNLSIHRPRRSSSTTTRRRRSPAASSSAASWST